MEPAIDRDMMLDAVMRRWPGTIRVLLRRGMLCVGCPVAGFDTIADAARAHGLDEAGLIEELARAAAGEDAPVTPCRGGLPPA